MKVQRIVSARRWRKGSACASGGAKTTEAHAGRERWAGARLAEEGVDRPQVARGDPILHGARSGNVSRATTTSATSRRWHWDEECTAIRPASPGASLERLTQAARAMEEEIEDGEFSPPEPYPEEGAVAEGEVTEEIDAIAQAAEPIEESDAVEILATWKQTRVAMNKQCLDR